MIFGNNDNKREIPVLFETDRTDVGSINEGATVKVNSSPVMFGKSKEELESEVKKYLEALLSGTEITQLTIDDSLTEKAKNSLIALQDALRQEESEDKRQELEALKNSCDSITSQIEALKGTYSDAIAERDNIANEIVELEAQRDALNATNGSLQEEQSKLQEQKESLIKDLGSRLAEVTKQKEQALTEEIEARRVAGFEALNREFEKKTSMNELELKQSMEAKRKELEKNNEEKIKELDKTISDKKKELAEIENMTKQWQEALKRTKENFDKIFAEIRKELEIENTVEWKTISKDDSIYAIPSSELKVYVERLIGTYSRKMNVTVQQAQDEFVANSPALFAIMERIEATTEGNKKSALGVYASNYSTVENAANNIKLPVYHTKSDKNANLSTNVINNIKLLEREAELENIALMEQARRIIAERRLKKVMNILLPYMPNNVDLQSVLGNDTEDITTWLKG